MDITQTARASGFWAAPSTLRLLTRIADASPLPTALVEGDEHRISFANQAFVSLLGRSAAALQGASFAGLASDVSLGVLLRQALQNEAGELRQDVSYTRPDGGTAYGSTFLTRIPGPAGMLLVQVIDATEQVLLRRQTTQIAQEAVQANERLVLAALREQELAERANQRAVEIKRLLDEKTLLAKASASLTASLDLHVTLQRAAEVSVPDFADAVVVTFTRDGAVEKATWWQPDARLEKLFQRAAHAVADTDSRLVESAALSLIHVNLSVRGQELGRMLFMRDAASWHFDEGDGEWARELGARVSTALDNAWLHQAAREAIRTRDDVLSMVSHDLRNPLSSLMLSVQQLLFGAPLEVSSPLFRKTLEVMHRSTKHMKRMVDELLELAGLQAGHFVLEYSSKSVGELLQEALEMVEPQAQQKHMQVRAQIEAPLQQVSCDPERVLRALGNLLSNAIKFTHEGGAIAVSCQVVDQAATSCGEGQLSIAISDTGVGIPAADLQHLFEPYWKGASTGRTGTGLGLYIARGVIQAHGGTLSVESTVGAGSTFTCTLPLRRDASS